MLLRRFGRHIRNQDWFAVLIDIVVVVVGLFLAFQADRIWEEQREKQQEAEYIQRLISDLQSDIPSIEYSIQLADLRLGFIELLMTVSDEPQKALEYPAVFLVAVNQAAFTYTPQLTSHTFEDLRSTGNMRLILDQEVKALLYKYYGFYTEQLQYRPLQFLTEFNHFKLAAGIKTLEQSNFIQDANLIIGPHELKEIQAIELEPAAVLEAAKRLQNKPELVNWLPSLRSLQLEQMEVHKISLQNAKDALLKLQAYAAANGF